MSKVVRLMLFSTVALSVFVHVTNAGKICTLDGMRKFAAEACENLFQNDIRTVQKRSISHRRHVHSGKHYLNSIDTEIQREDAAHRNLVKVRKPEFPSEGYLVLEHHHAVTLNSQDSDYVIKPLPEHIKSNIRAKNQEYNSTSRRKRQSNHKIQVPYCCIHECETRHFC